MDSRALLIDSFERVAELVAGLTKDVTVDDLTRAPAEGANPPAWLLWHLSRVQDDHVAAAFGLQQVWFTGWADRFALPFTAHDTGYGMAAADVLKVRTSGELLGGYHAAVHAQTVQALSRADLDLDRVVDDSYDPPVTLGARLVSVLGDDLQHVGQAAYVLGLP